MKSDKIIMYITEISLTIFLLCCIFFAEIFTKTVIGIVLLVFMVISDKLVKSYKLKGRYDRKLTNFMASAGIIYIALLYILGIYIGFYNATVKFSLWTIINYIIPYIVIIISIENIRKTILLKEDKISNIILLIVTVILDVAITTNIYNVKTLNDYFMLIGFIIFSSISNNLLFNHIIKKYRNCKAIIVYRLITTIYVYIIPIIPNIHILFESILRIIVPYIIYLVMELMYSKKEKDISTSTQTKDIIVTAIVTIIATGIVMLISCQFKYGILVIGSGSMTGTINKGDAIIYERFDKDDDIVEVGDVIVFTSNKVRVIHRVIEKKDTGSGMKYYTKGDANPNEDEGYRVEDDIVGKVKLRIPYIGQPTVLLNEMFESRTRWRIRMEEYRNNDDIVLYHIRKRKKRKVILLTVTILLIAIALIPLGMYYTYNKEYYIDFKETSKVNYGVNLIENDYYNKTYIEDDIDVIASLIRNIKTQFKYTLDLEEQLQYSYNYKIVAEIKVKEKSKTNYLYETEQELLNKKTRTGKSKKLEITEKINIDYNKYNEYIKKLIEEYKLQNITSELHVCMYVNVTNTTTKQQINKQNKVMSLVMPLTTKTVEITIDENLANDKNGQILVKGKLYEDTEYLLVIGGIILLAGFITLGCLIKYNSDTRSAEKMYDDELKKILFDYKSYIQKINNKVPVKDYKIIKVDTFKELLAMREEIEAPILMYTEEDEKRTIFMLINGDLLFAYILEAKLIREKLIKKSREKAER